MLTLLIVFLQNWDAPLVKCLRASGLIKKQQEPDRIVYLGIPVETYEDFFQLPFIQRSLKRYQVKLMIYDPKLEEIKQWID